jgi:hypothetical protein
VLSALEETLAMSLTLGRLVSALRCAGLNNDDIAAGRQAQTIVYLLGRAGADLGYGYGWEMFGPFSEGLAEILNETTLSTVSSFTAPAPRDVRNAADRIEKVRAANPGLASDELWLRLVASVDFLENRAKVSVGNGSTPRYLQNFAPDVIGAAKAALPELSSVEF